MQSELMIATKLKTATATETKNYFTIFDTLKNKISK